VEFSLWVKLLLIIKLRVNLHWITKWGMMCILIDIGEVTREGFQVGEAGPSGAECRRVTLLL
jgi:hypothetical protein